MWFFNTNLGRLLLFILLTIMEILLVIFLLFHGTLILKGFAMILLVVQLFASYKIYTYTSNMFGFRKD